MFSKLSNLINQNVFFVSRQKTLLKRRKMTSKKQKMAKKKFLEQNPQGSYTNELKILQIQKQLDRKVNKNHHLNQLMDELFYPDVRYANQKLLQQNLLNLANNPQQALPNKNQQHKNFKDRQQQQQQQHNDQQLQQQQIDPLVQQIYLCQIPSQLFQLYLKNSSLLTHSHLILFLQRLEYYFSNKSIIQDRVTYKWKQSLEKLKIPDVERKKKRRCPYVFIEREELIRDEQWNRVVKDINRKIGFTTVQIANQQLRDEGEQQHIAQFTTMQQQLHQHQQQYQSSQQSIVDSSFYSLQNNCHLVLNIYQLANYIPEQLFQTIVKKMLIILQLNHNKQLSSQSSSEQQKSQQQQHQQRLPIFSYNQKVNLLRLLSLKSMTKSTITKSVHIESIQQSQKEEQKLIAIGKKLCEDVLNSMQCSAEDIGVVVGSSAGRLKFLNSRLLEMCQPKILKHLSSTSLQRSIDYLSVYWQNATTKNPTFINLLIFDIYRKLPYSTSKYHLLLLFNMIKHSRLQFRQSKIIVSISDIYPRCVEMMTKYVNSNQLKHEEIKFFIESIYQNYPLYKMNGLMNVLEMVATGIVKIGQGFRLQQISQLLFRITVMGNRSRIFSKYVFQRYLKEYRKLMKQYKQTRIQLIVDKSKSLSNGKGQRQQQQDNMIGESQMPSMNEIILQQSLIMMLWSFIISFNSSNTQLPLPLSEMIQLYPVYIRSQDLMISDLIDDLNIHLHDLNYFPIIKNKQIYETRINDNRRKSLKAVKMLIKTNTKESYRYHCDDVMVEEMLKKLEDGKEEISGKVVQRLVRLLIKYYAQRENVDLGKFMDRWNDCVEDVFAHRDAAAYQTKKAFLQHIGKTSSQQSNKNQTLSLAKRIAAIIQKQQTTPSKLQQKSHSNSHPSHKGYKLYQLL